MLAEIETPSRIRAVPVPGAPLGAVVEGFDLRGLAAAEVPGLKRLLADHGVVAFRGQSATPDELAALGAMLGPLEDNVLKEFTRPEQPKVFVLSNIIEDGRAIGSVKSGTGWHTDQGYLEHPTSYTLLYGVEVPPEGGDTLFASTVRALEALPATERERLAGLSTLQSYRYFFANRYLRPGAGGSVPTMTTEDWARLPDVEHPLIRRNVVNGQLAIYLGGNSLAAFPGLDAAEGRALAERLFAHCTEERFVHAHRWQPGDLVIWDNSVTMHRAGPYDRSRYRRHLWRVSVTGERPVGA